MTAGAKHLERVQELGKGIGAPTAQVALAYVSQQPFQTFPLVAAWSKEEFNACATALDIKPADKNMAWLHLRVDERYALFLRGVNNSTVRFVL